MKKLIVFFSAVLLAIPVVSTASEMYLVNATADCSNWFSSVNISWRGDTNYDIVMDWEVTLLDEADSPVFTFVGSENLTNDFSIYNFGEAWPTDLELCGTYTAQINLNLTAPWTSPVWGDGIDYASLSTITDPFTCDCEEEACHYTPGYWKNHLDMWPSMTLTVGGVEMNQDELVEIMDTPVRGDATIILAYHLIAAKLNVLNGADNSINSAIAGADAYLEDHPIGSKPNRNYRDEGLALKDLLANYNEMGCPEDPFLLKDSDEGLGQDSEGTSWDNLKARYR
jgi:hypothetical protein